MGALSLFVWISVLLLCLIDSSTLAWNAAELSCSNARKLVPDGKNNRSVSWKDYFIFSDLQPGAADSVCGLRSSCCTASGEEFFGYQAASKFQETVTRYSDTFMDQCPYNSKMADDWGIFIDGVRDDLVSLLKRAYFPYYPRDSTVVEELYMHIKLAITNGNMCGLKETFYRTFYRVFMVTFLAYSFDGESSRVPDTRHWDECTYESFISIFGDLVGVQYNGFIRSFKPLVLYIRSMEVLKSALKSISDFRLSSSCQKALLRMTECKLCAGYTAEEKPCEELCLNSVRGCIFGIEELVDPLKKLVQELSRMAQLLQGHYSTAQQINYLGSFFFRVIDDTTARQIEVPDVGINGLFQGDLSTTGYNFNKLQIEVSLHCYGDEPSTEPPTSAVHLRHIRSIEPQPPTTSASPPSRGSPRPSSVRRLSTPPSVAFASDCLSEALQSFSFFPEFICSELSSRDNDKCWTGQSVGKYMREVASFDRQSQEMNPEVSICSHFSSQINEVQHFTELLHVFASDHTCQYDDEDCLTERDVNLCSDATVLDGRQSSGSGLDSGVLECIEEGFTNPFVPGSARKSSSSSVPLLLLWSLIVCKSLL